MDPALSRPRRALHRPATWRDLRIYVYELPAWLNLEIEMDMYAGHVRFDSIYSGYNLFFERLLADKCVRGSFGFGRQGAFPPAAM